MPEQIMIQVDEVERPATPAEIAWIEVVRQSNPVIESA
jgi:desulfoferrodoxin (superoxide reductase-like protein)